MRRSRANVFLSSVGRALGGGRPCCARGERSERARSVASARRAWSPRAERSATALPPVTPAVSRRRRGAASRRATSGSPRSRRTRSGTSTSCTRSTSACPGCPSCPSPTMILQVSRDRGNTWGAPRLIAPPGPGQFDAQVAVDPVDGRTAYAAWLQDSKSDIAVATVRRLRRHLVGRGGEQHERGDRQADHGGPRAARVRGVQPLAEGLGRVVPRRRPARSSNATVNANAQPRLVARRRRRGRPGRGGATSPGPGYKKNGQAKGPVNLYVSRSTERRRDLDEPPGGRLRVAARLLGLPVRLGLPGRAAHARRRRGGRAVRAVEHGDRGRRARAHLLRAVHRRRA